MQIPKRMKIGRHKYTVKVARHSPTRGTMGEVAYACKLITLGTHSAITGSSYKAEDIRDTFWHELTHAILYEMGHPYWNNEKFVAKFASYLTKAIDSAEF
jgi:hypothetical protein